MIKFKWLLALFIYFGLIYSSNASELNFYHLNTKHGLSQNTVNFIHQDKQGFFWFGTNGGLNQWNGYDFTTYTYSNTDTFSIGQGRVNCFHEDPNGDLWFGTLQGGVSKYNPEINGFTNYPFNIAIDKNQHNISTLQINRFNGKIIIGTFRNGLYILNQDTKDFTKVNIINSNNEPLPTLSINKLYIDKDSTLWIGHNTGVIRAHIQEIDKESPVVKGEEILKGKRILSIYRDSKDLIWFGTHQSGVFFMNLKNAQIIPLKNALKSKIEEYSIIRDFNEDRNGNLWIGTGGNGINVIDANFNPVYHLKNELNNNNSISSNIIYCLYLDQNKNMWVGTYNGGVNYTNNHKQSFNHIKGTGGKNELSNNAILSMIPMRNGKIMIGTDGDGISFFNPKDGSFTPFVEFNNHNKDINSVAVSMGKDNNGNIFIGTYLKGFYTYNEQSKKLKHFSAGNETQNLPSNDIWAICPDNNKSVWLGTLGKGLCKFNIKSQKFKTFTSNQNSDNSLCDNYISSLLLDSKNQLWIGTQNNGISVLVDEDKGIFKNYNKYDASELSSNEIYKIFEDTRGNIWVCTHDGGICLFNKQTNKFKTITTNDGLLSNTNRSIIEDHLGKLWVGSNKGISVLSVTNERISITNYTQNNGLQSNEFNFNAVLKTKNNFIYMGGNNGFNYFHPDSLIISNKVGPLVITKIETLFDDDSGIRKTKAPNNNQDTVLEYSYELALISFEYALLDYSVPELNTYEYMLEGYDNQWKKVNTKRTATYTNLDPGKYTFRVKGTNGLGVKIPDEQQLKILIHPPFWKETWFILLSIALIIFTAYLTIRNKLKAYRLQEDILIEKVNSRTKELLSLNNILEVRNREIKQQSEELKTKSEHLNEAYNKLENSNVKIENQNFELEQHRNNLEQLVKKRTKQLESAKIKAEESERLKMAFLANMSHEIRTPMNAIMGFSALLSDDEYNSSDRKKYSSIIKSNSESLLLLIDDILDLSKIEANQLKIYPSSFDFLSVYKETIANWGVINQDNEDVVFEYKNHLERKELPIYSDMIRLKQIINNLIDNAFKFTCVGSVTFSIKINNEQLICSVSDTGLGISDEELPKIFDRFRKSEDYTNKEFRGAGLGLTISKKLAILLKGDLWVESELGKGSTFHLTLPLK